MGKKSIDVGGTVDEINTEAALIANAAQKIDLQRRIPEAGDANSATPRQRATPESKQGAGDLEVVAGTKRGSRPTTRKPSGTGRDAAIRPEKESLADDPWVTGTVKMRNSKKKLLKKLSLTRELDGLAPHQQKDLVDEALDYILDKYQGA